MVEDEQRNVFGGYTSTGWGTKEGWVRDLLSYIYTIINPHGIPTTKYVLTDTGVNKRCCICSNKNLLTSVWWGQRIQRYFHCRGFQQQQILKFPLSSIYIDTTGKGTETFTGEQYLQVKEIELWGSLFEQYEQQQQEQQRQQQLLEEHEQLAKQEEEEEDVNFMKFLKTL